MQTFTIFWLIYNYNKTVITQFIGWKDSSFLLYPPFGKVMLNVKFQEETFELHNREHGDERTVVSTRCPWLVDKLSCFTSSSNIGFITSPYRTSEIYWADKWSIEHRYILKRNPAISKCLLFNTWSKLLYLNTERGIKKSTFLPENIWVVLEKHLHDTVKTFVSVLKNICVRPQNISEIEMSPGVCL